MKKESFVYYFEPAIFHSRIVEEIFLTFFFFSFLFYFL